MLESSSAIRLIDYLKCMWQSDLNVSYNRNMYISFYGGEPLMNMPFIKSVVAHLKKINCHNRTFTFSMTTNAILLDKHIDFLVENNFKLLISLDGNKKNSSYRVFNNGNEAFDTIIKNIDIIKTRYPDYFDKNVNFNAVLHNRNSVESIYSFFKQQYNKMPRIGELNNSGIREDKISDFEKAYKNVEESLGQAEHYSEIIEDMSLQLGTYQTASTYILKYNPFVYNDYNELLFGKNDESPKIPTGTCMPFSKKIYMTVNGKLLPCERIGHQFALGYVTEKDIIIDSQSIADKYNSYYNKLEHQCKSCYQKRSCIQCLYNLPQINSSNVKCLGFMNKAQFSNYQNAQISFFAKNPREYYKIMEEIVVV